tara:strand:- start:161 stop:292 length:132 start_codon:yes stop_codon:yes gene_type:complete
MAEKMMTDRPSAPIERDEIYRLMRGNGNQSRINDGQRVIPDRS